MEPWSPAWKQAQLDAMHEAWSSCQGCQLHETRNKVVFGEGNPDADLMFISEGPGAQEDKTGVPFSAREGNAGELLNMMFDTVGIDRREVYIQNIVACRPPDNRDPIAVEKDACLPRVHEVIYIVDPLIIVTLGKYALTALVKGRSWSIEAEHGKLFSSPSPDERVTGERNGVEIEGRVFPRKGETKAVHRLEYDLIPLFHPAYILRVDSYDKKTGQFAAGGVAHRTLDDLGVVLDRLHQLKDKHNHVTRILERI